MQVNEKQFNKNYIGVALMMICSVCLCMGQFIWKKSDSVFLIMMGFAVYGIGAIAMIIAYHFGKLSILQPINSFSYIVSAILGMIFFDEPFTLIRIIGILLIMAGVIVLARLGGAEAETV